MNCIKKSLVCAVAAGAATLATATPVVGNVTMSQGSSGRLVTITYTLTEDAVVTLDVMTNATPNAATGWASIGGKAVCNAKGAVWRKVTSADADGQGKYTITWRPDLSWTDNNGKGFNIAEGCAKAVVTAYALDNTPDYMVVDISATSGTVAPAYYPSADFLPGGLLSNPDYRTSAIVMRKIMAKDVTWTMGSTVLETQRNATPKREDAHRVTLTNNYYIGVFEVTQAQWALIHTENAMPSRFNNAAVRAMRPVEYVCFNEIRNTTAENFKNPDPAYDWPASPNPVSFLGLLRSKTGNTIDFDLPSEAQWEFAARAGNGDTKWGDGSGILNTDTDANLDLLGRYKMNGGYIDGSTVPATSCGADNGTAIVGSYAPNNWGLYDMHGNVTEWCLDSWVNDITANGGRVTFDAANNAHALRGGNWSDAAGSCRPAQRTGYVNYQRINFAGLRLVCTAGLK